jgi:uncharacterized protein
MNLQPLPPAPSRRRCLLGLGLVSLALVSALPGCGTPAAPPALYQLPATPPEPVTPVRTAQVLQILAPVVLPELLERSAMLMPQGTAGVQALDRHRWAEPLRDAVPRLLRQDLAALLGEDRVWAAPLPPGLSVTRQLRVEILVFQPSTDRRTVRLQARLTLADPAGGAPPQVVQAQIDAPSASAEPDALAAAHRLALWRLAEQIAAAL